MFRALKDQVVRNEKMWRAWYEENEPENVAIPDYETELSGNIDTGGFWRMVLVRSLREDRTTLAVTQFIRTTETVPFEKTRIGAVAEYLHSRNTLAPGAGNRAERQFAGIRCYAKHVAKGIPVIDFCG